MASVVDSSASQVAIPLMVFDPAAAERLLAERRRLGQDRKDEVWNGTYIMSPDPTFSHNLIAFELCSIFSQTQKSRGAKAYPGGNVSDRAKSWEQNFRCPDVIVLFPNNQAKNLDTVLVGGPDFAVEILSPHDRAREKLPFYGKIKTRECLYIDREQECVELYCLNGEQMDLVAVLSAKNGVQCHSQVLQLDFCVLRAGEQTFLEVRQLSEPMSEPNQTWRVDLLV
jgi:Uma2 family endonuclease